MKQKNLCTAVATILLSLYMLPAYCQQQQTTGEHSRTPKLGVKAGVNLSNMYVHDVQDENMKVGLNLGLVAKLPVTKGFSIQPELLYSSKGAKEHYDNAFGTGEYRFNLNYIEMPLLAVINITPNFNIHGGPYIAYLASANIKDMNSDGTIQNAKDLNAENFNRFDYGLAGGLGIDIQNFAIGARYTYGLHEIGKPGTLSGDLTQNSKNSVITLYIGIGF